MAGSTYLLRAARPDESGRLFSAIEKWGDPYVLGRPESELRAAAEQGFFFVITDEHDTEILALSAVFTLRESEYVETGNTYVGEDLRGFGIQTLFFQMRIATVVWSEGTKINVTTAINPSNLPSLKNKDDAGFVPMKPIGEHLTPCKDCNKRPPEGSPQPCCCAFYLLPVDRMRQATRDLLARSSAGTIDLRHRDGAAIRLTVKAKVVTDPDARIALAEYANGANWP